MTASNAEMAHRLPRFLLLLTFLATLCTLIQEGLSDSEADDSELAYNLELRGRTIGKSQKYRDGTTQMSSLGAARLSDEELKSSESQARSHFHSDLGVNGSGRGTDGSVFALREIRDHSSRTSDPNSSAKATAALSVLTSDVMKQLPMFVHKMQEVQHFNEQHERKKGGIAKMLNLLVDAKQRALAALEEEKRSGKKHEGSVLSADFQKSFHAALKEATIGHVETEATKKPDSTDEYSRSLDAVTQALGSIKQKQDDSAVNAGADTSSDTSLIQSQSGIYSFSGDATPATSNASFWSLLKRVKTQADKVASTTIQLKANYSHVKPANRLNHILDSLLKAAHFIQFTAKSVDQKPPATQRDLKAMIGLLHKSEQFLESTDGNLETLKIKLAKGETHGLHHAQASSLLALNFSTAARTGDDHQHLEALAFFGQELHGKIFQLTNAGNKSLGKEQRQVSALDMLPGAHF